MTARRFAAPVTALLAAVMLAGSALPASAARGTQPDADREQAEAEAAAEEEEVNPCPENLWTVALPIEGLACILLLPKDEQDQDAQKAAEEKKNEKRRR